MSMYGSIKKNIVWINGIHRAYKLTKSDRLTITMIIQI